MNNLQGFFQKRRFVSFNGTGLSFGSIKKLMIDRLRFYKEVDMKIAKIRKLNSILLTFSILTYLEISNITQSQNCIFYTNRTLAFLKDCSDQTTPCPCYILQKEIVIDIFLQDFLVPGNYI